MTRSDLEYNSSGLSCGNIKEKEVANGCVSTCRMPWNNYLYGERAQKRRKILKWEKEAEIELWKII